MGISGNGSILGRRRWEIFVLGEMGVFWEVRNILGKEGMLGRSGRRMREDVGELGAGDSGGGRKERRWLRWWWDG